MAVKTQERPINYSQFREQLGIEIKH
jgi:hypothetical protein